jgi:hypothetical protein
VALQKQVITLDFGFGGLDQKQDDKLVRPTRLAAVTDARFNKAGRIDKRPGFTPIESATTSGYAYTPSKLLANVDQLAVVDGIDDGSFPTVWRISSNGAFERINSSFFPPGVLGVPEIVCKPEGSRRTWGVVSGTAVQGTYDRADSENYYCIVHGYNSSPTTYISCEVFDRQTGALLTDFGNAFEGIAPRVFADPLGRDNFILAWRDDHSATTIQFRTIRVVSGVATSSTVTSLADETSVNDSDFDVIGVADANSSSSALAFVVFCKNTSGYKLNVCEWPVMGGASMTAAVVSTTTIAPGAGNCTRVAFSQLHNPSDTTANVRVLHFESGAGAGVRTTVFNHSRTIVLGPTTITSLTASVPEFMTGSTFSYTNAAGIVERVFLDYPGSVTQPYNRSLQIYGMNASNTAFSLTALGGLSLATRAAARPTGGVVYVWTTYSSTGQNTNFLLGVGARETVGAREVATLGQINHGYAYQSWYRAIDAQRGLPNLQWHAASGEYVCGMLQAKRVVRVLNMQNDAWAIQGVHFRGNEKGVGWLGVQNRNELLVTGGHLSLMNGVEGPIPAGPQLWPQIVTASSTTGGSMATGSYAVSGLFEYTDSAGRVYRSAPATPVTVTVSGTNNCIAVVAETYRLPDELQAKGRLRWVPFRTLVNTGQVYYRAHSATAITTAATVSVTLTLADATIAANEPLYTVGTVQPNWLPAAPIALATNGRRYLAVSGDRPTFVIEGKILGNTSGPAFFEEVGKEIAPHGDRIYGLASYLDKWFAFKSGAVFVAAGDGADNTGQNDTLSEFEPLSVGIGCVEPRSIVTTNAGVLFKSGRGIYIVGGDLQTSFIGAAVEDHNDATVVDSAYDKDGDRAYFVMSSGVTLVLTVFNTEAGYDFRWTVDNVGGNAVGYVPGRGRVVATSVSVTTSGSQRRTLFEESATYTDRNVSTTATPDFDLTSAWAPMATIQGFGRVWRANVLGQFLAGQASMTVTVQVGYDYADDFEETHTISSDDFDVQGDNARFEIRPRRQKCEAIRFRITQTGSDSGFSLNQIQLVVGVKPPDNRRGASHRARRQ